MKKNTLFLSAGITTFILVILAGLIFKLRISALVAPVAAQSPTIVPTQVPIDTQQPTATATDTVQPTVAGVINPQEAVFIASRALGNTKVYRVDTETRYGLDVYKVTFSSGHVVYISPRGMILAINSPQAVVIQPAVDQSSDNTPARPKKTGNPVPPTPPPSGGDGGENGND